MAFSFAFHVVCYSAVAIHAVALLVEGVALPSHVRNAIGSDEACNGVRAGPADFTYDMGSPNGPLYWGQIKSDYAKCGTGTQQSSFDVRVSSVDSVTSPNATVDVAPVIALNTAGLQFEETPRNFELKCESGNCGSIKYMGQTYSMEQAHFHKESEHHLNGVGFELEGHFVHSTANGSRAVLAVFFTEGEENDEFWKVLDIAERRGFGEVKLSSFYDTTGTLCATMGSLTTPPCTENVSWFIGTSALSVSREQLDKFLCMLGGTTNNRPIQPANDRLVVCYKG